MKNKGKYVVEKRNILNEIISSKFTLQELRLFSIYLGRINARETSTRIVRLSVAQFCKVMGIVPQKISYLKQATDGLMTKAVDVPNTDNDGYTTFQLFKKCRIDYDEHGWYFEIDAHDDALPLMFKYRKDYFNYELWNVLNLESANQLRMYELLKQGEWDGERIISVTKLRALLGIEEHEYQRFNNFKSRVLDSCQKAFNLHTDISFTYEPYARGGFGGKIISLRFVITKNPNYKRKINLDELFGTGGMAVIENGVKQEIENIPDVSDLSFLKEMSEKDKVAILKATDGDVENIRVAYDMAKQQGNIKSLTAWIIHMVGELQDGQVEPPVKVNRQQPKNRFVNFNQRDIDFAELERLELEQLKESMGHS
jgi:plasmid replication initiation protein